MISTLRASVRLAVLLPFTLLCWVALLVGLTLALPSRRWRRRLQRGTFRFWSRAFCRLLGARIEVRGEAPRPPCLVVSNHLSYVDVMVLATALPARFVAKAEVRRWPLVGLVSTSVDTLFVDRSARRDALRVGNEMAEGLARGDAILFFPEGTSTHGHTVAPFKPPLLAPAAAARLPVHYAACHYSTPPGQPPAHLRICWWGEMPFVAHFWKLLALPGFTARITFGRHPVSDPDRKELARRLHAGVCEIFEPVVDHVPSATGYEPRAETSRSPSPNAAPPIPSGGGSEAGSVDGP